MKTLSCLMAGALCLALGACSDEPSESAMRDAAAQLFTKLRRDQAEASTFMLGARRDAQGFKPVTISSFEKEGCLPAKPLDGHLCVFMVSVDGAEKVKAHGRFYKAADGTLTVTGK